MRADYKSDGAFYTTDMAAVMLALLAFPPDYTDWLDVDKVCGQRIIDPACGDGALLVATIQAFFIRMDKARRLAGKPAFTADEKQAIKDRLLEKAICGLDIEPAEIAKAKQNLMEANYGY